MSGPPPDPPHAVFLVRMVLHPQPIVTTSDMEDVIDLSDEGIRRRFTRLQEMGLVEGKDVGSAAKVWWVTDRGRKYIGMADLDVQLRGDVPQLAGIQ